MAAIKGALEKQGTSINKVSPEFELCRPRASKCLKSVENVFLESDNAIDFDEIYDGESGRAWSMNYLAINAMKKLRKLETCENTCELAI